MGWSGSSGSQSFSRTNGDNTGSTTWQQDAAESVGITAARHDTHDQDISDGINACLKKDGGNTATANLPMGGFRHTNVGDAAARTQYASFGQVQDGDATYYPTVGGTANAITISGAGAAITAYVAGQTFSFIAASTNTSTTTLTVDSVSAIDVRKNDGSATALSGGEIVANALTVVQYNGSVFLLMSTNLQGLDLTAIEALSGTGILRRSGTNTWALDADVTHLADTTADRLYGTDGSGNSSLITLSGLTLSAAALSVDAASDSAAGKIEIAVQSEMETGTSTTLAVTPGRQHFHPGHPKCWGYVTVSGGTPTLQTSHNITSITDTDVGKLTWTIATDFSSANWASLGTQGESGEGRAPTVQNKAAGTIEIGHKSVGAGFTDPSEWSFVGFGDHA
jgi:hypothetical protein